MFRIFYAQQDATLYESAPNYNTGIDEILEIGKRLDTIQEHLNNKGLESVKFVPPTK